MAGNTYIYPKNEDLEIVVGDEKQEDFYPRVKIKRWNNEVNFSVGVVSDHVGSDSKIGDEVEWDDGHGTKAKFYEKKPTILPTIIPDLFRYINLGAIAPDMMERIYEIERHGVEPTIITYTPDANCFMVYGHQPFTDYIDKEHTINEVRLLRFGGNSDIMFFDPNTVIIDIQFDSSVYSSQKIFDIVSGSLCNEFGLHGIGRYYNDEEEKVATLIQSKNHVVGYIRFQTIDRSKFLQYCNESVNDEAQKYKVGSVDGDINTFIESLELNMVNGEFASEELNYQKIAGDYDIERNILEIEAQNLFDRFEFEIELESAPPTNTIILSIETKGLDFFYQPYEVPERCFRPDNVKCSYAVYHNGMRGGKYRAGKAFHIYRPFVTDANGKREWCEMDITGNIMQITVPDGLIYPVVVDPTFGCSPSVPGSSWGAPSGNWMIGSVFTSPANIGTAQSMSAYVKVGSGKTVYIKCVLVLHSNLNIITNGVGSPSAAMTSTTGAWAHSDFANDPDPANSTEYVLFEIGDAAHNIAFDDGDSHQGHKDLTNSYASPTNPTDASDDSYEYSVYCTYTIAATGIARRKVHGGLAARGLVGGGLA